MKKRSCLSFGVVSLFLIGTFFGLPHLCASEAKSNNHVEYTKDRLTVNVDKLALGLLLRTIREKTGIEFEVGLDESRKLISVQFGPLPVEEGLKRILSRVNSVLFFDPDNKVANIVIIGVSQAEEKASSIPGNRTTTSEKMRPRDPQSEISKSFQERVPIESQAERNNSDVPVPSAKETSPQLPDLGTGEKMANPSPVLTAQRMVIEPPSVQMHPQPSFETMVVRPPPETQMAVRPSNETMVIQLPNGQNMTVRGNK
jgi:hypothetical protein